MNSDDEHVRKISKMLELGGTMLAEHCETCSSPMFRYHGNVICPVCNTREEGQATEVPATPITPASTLAPEPKLESRRTSAPMPAVSSDEMLPLEELILKKMTDIANSMQDETDPRRISEQLDIIERGLGVVEQLRNIV